MSIEAQRQELQRLGFKIIEDSGDRLVATTKRFHWDCVCTRLSYVVVVREVPELTPESIAADRTRLEEEARQLDPSSLPRGLQKGTAVVAAYVADRVTPAARDLCAQSPKTRFAYFYIPAVLDRGAGVAHYVKGTP